MENLNHKTVESHQLPRRSRYYQAAIDIDHMDRGNSYRKLPESNVLFICTFDPFGYGLGRYTSTESCEEKAELKLNDGTRKIFFNCCYQGDELTEDLRKLYDYVESGNVGNELTERLERAVDQGRKNAVWRSQYMKERVIIQDAMDEGIELGFGQGIEQGIEQGRSQMIEGMLRRGKTVDEIVDFCDYPRELVEKVRADMEVIRCQVPG